MGTVINIRPYKGMEAETNITWDATKDVDGLDGYELASSEFVNQYTSHKAREGQIQKLFIADVNSDDGSVFQIPVIETPTDNIQKLKAQTKVASKILFPAEKLTMPQKTVIMIRPYRGQESETKITWDATGDVEQLDGYQLASSEFVNQYTSQKAEEGKIQKLFIAEVNSADGSVFQVPVVETHRDAVQKVKAQTKVASKLKFPAEKVKTQQKTVIKIRPYVSKESEANITWDATEDVKELEGYQLASSEFVSQYSSQKAKEGKLQKLFVAEVNSADGSIFQVPVVETLAEDIQKAKAQTKVASKLKFPAEKLKTPQKTVINIRPYMGMESEAKITWDATEDVEGLEGYQV